jgi:hypothetical protein
MSGGTEESEPGAGQAVALAGPTGPETTAPPVP